MVDDAEQRLINRIADRMLEQHGARAIELAEMLTGMATPQGMVIWREVVKALYGKKLDESPAKEPAKRR